MLIQENIPINIHSEKLQVNKEARKARQAAKKAAEKAREERNEAIATAAGILLAVAVCITAVYYLGVYLERW